uniref:Sugar transporter SWEET1 n=1 Tax=Megaselia scalaris TaxID=36166 RepID=T1H7H1_MEGSC
ILNDHNMYNVNLLGLVVNAVYLSGFLYYTPNNLKGDIYTSIGKCIAFSVVVIAYATIEDKEKIEFRFGMILTGILLFLVGMPLLDIPQIIKNKCTEGMPFPIILSLLFPWTLYGFATRNQVFI